MFHVYENAELMVSLSKNKSHVQSRCLKLVHLIHSLSFFLSLDKKEFPILFLDG